MPKFHVEESIEISAPLEKVYATVRDFESWPSWSPWLIAEPDCQVENDSDGKGYSWDGEIVGSGKMRIKEAKEKERIDYDLHFLKPWKSYADVSMKFSTTGEGDEAKTKVAWSMDSALPIFLFWMKKTMASLIGMDYARGLMMLKDKLELGTVQSQLSYATVSHEPVLFIGIRSRCDICNLGSSMEGDIESLDGWVKSSGMETTGKLRSFYHKWDVVKQVVEYSIGYPVARAPALLPPGMVKIELPAIESYAISHTGRYDHLGNAWSAGIMHGRSGKFKQRRGIHPFEIYEKRQGEVPSEELLTVVHFPLK